VDDGPKTDWVDGFWRYKAYKAVSRCKLGTNK